MYSCGPPHTDVQEWDDQHELTYSSYVRTRDVTLKTCRRRWMIGRNGERRSGISALVARHDDDDDHRMVNPWNKTCNNRYTPLATTPADCHTYFEHKLVFGERIKNNTEISIKLIENNKTVIHIKHFINIIPHAVSNKCTDCKHYPKHSSSPMYVWGSTYTAEFGAKNLENDFFVRSTCTLQFTVRSAYDKFPDFFSMGNFIDSTHMKL